MRLLSIAILFLFSIIAAPVPVLAEDSSTSKEFLITSCGINITQPGVYYLTNNLSVSSGVCITIKSNNVTIDGRGYSIINTGNGLGIKYYLSGSSNSDISLTISNITIRNINFYNFDGTKENYAIYLHIYTYASPGYGSRGSSIFQNVNLINISLYNSPQGIYWYGYSWGYYCYTGFNNNTLENIYLYNSPRGLTIYGDQCTISFTYNNISNIYLYNSSRGLYIEVDADFFHGGQTFMYNRFSNINSSNSQAPIYISAYIYGSTCGYETFANNTFSDIYGQNTSKLLYIYSYGNCKLAFENNSFYCVLPYDQIFIANPPKKIEPTLQSDGSYYWSDSERNVYKCNKSIPSGLINMSIDIMMMLSSLTAKFTISNEYKNPLNLSCIDSNIPSYTCNFDPPVINYKESSTLTLSIKFPIYAGTYYVTIKAQDVYTNNYKLYNITINIIEYPYVIDIIQNVMESLASNVSSYKKVLYRSIAAGEYHTCILTKNGNVYCNGDNYSSQAIKYAKGDIMLPFREWLL